MIVKRDRRQSPRHEAPDIASSTDEYQARFTGAVGRYFVDKQTTHVMEMLEETPIGSVLDVGGGHGQLAIPLVRAGFDVTVMGSDASCELLIRRTLPPHQYHFVEGDLLELPFPDQSVDVAVCFRLMAHVTNWQQLVQELCRVAREGVVIDYPDRQSVNHFQNRLFVFKQAIEKNARRFQTIDFSELTEAFSSSNFRIVRSVKQYLLPMALHRGIGSRVFSSASERVFATLGLTSRWGSPGIVYAKPTRPNEVVTS